ncbi:MAG: bifunctional shikimate kinase/3-dehydroquinate synthase [Victivallales bacterium]|nr:bifunctional shikimate kinase/3-dehydroquinate synthase [Victivallales bacterium]
MINQNIIFLYGPPASGKTTLGQCLAKQTGALFFDVDAVIVQNAGKSIADIFASEGEPAFRSLEKNTLRQVIEACSKSGGVISLGGGTLLDAENRSLCEKTGAVFCLDTPSEEELAFRLNLAPGSRPLGNRAHERAAHYASFNKRIANSFMLPDSLVVVGTGIAEALMPSAVTVFDENVARCHPALSQRHLALIPSGECHKTPETVMMLWHSFAIAGLGRRDCVAACGGGVTGDLTGFAAATWMRGINWMNFPTTLLAMVDASTGGKTGCDLPDGKNLAGAFHQPKIVVIDTDFLKSLPDEILKAGRAEMIKHEIIGNLPRNPINGGIPTAQEIAMNLAVKVAIVREDPLERLGKRILLNCGHTVAHAIEAASGYRLSHGQAVAIGCVEEARHAVRRGLAPKTWPEKLAERFMSAGLPVNLPKGMDFVSLSQWMRGDKKRQGDSVVFALPCGWGDVRAVKETLP